MGDDFINSLTTSFRRKAEKIHDQEFNQCGIFTVIPEETCYVVRFRAPNATPKLNDEVWLADIPGKDGIRVLHNLTPIGEVDAAGSIRLRKLLADKAACGGVLPGVIVSEKDIAGYSKAKVSL